MNKIKIFFILILFASCQSAKERLAEEIKNGEMKLFNDTVKTLNTDVANAVFKNYLDYADKYGDDTASAAYLFKAGDLSTGLHRPKEAIEIYERLILKYPHYRKTAAALFMEGFVYETALMDKDKAKAKYKEFIDKYPDHALAASAKASLDQLNANISDEELIKSFEQKNSN